MIGKFANYEFLIEADNTTLCRNLAQSTCIFARKDTPFDITATEERARTFVEAQQWKFAKTMADIPHFYCLKKNAPDQGEFEWFVRHLVAHSVSGAFYGKTYQYFFLGEWKYWIMDEDLGDYDLINRECQLKTEPK